MTPFYWNNVLRLISSLVTKGNKYVISSQTEITYYPSTSPTWNISMYFCSMSKSHSVKEKVCNENYCNEVLPKKKQDPSNDTDVKRAFNLLLQSGIDMTSLSEYEPYLSKSPKESYMKAKLLTQIAFHTPITLPLIKLPVTRLKCILMRSRADRRFLNSDFPDRISYLCHHLEVNPSELIDLLSKHSTLLAMEFERLKNKMSVLKGAGIGAEYLVKDLWIFNYNEKALMQRIEKAQQAGVSIKPWLLRCSSKSFVSILSKWKNTQNVLKGKNEVTYLAEKLNCSEDYVKYMMSINKLLTTINVPKLEQVINFLYEKGYTPEEVRIFPRVFCSSVKTLSRRFDQCYRGKGTMPTMSQLCFSRKDDNFANGDT